MKREVVGNISEPLGGRSFRRRDDLAFLPIWMLHWRPARNNTQDGSVFDRLALWRLATDTSSQPLDTIVSADALLGFGPTTLSNNAHRLIESVT